MRFALCSCLAIALTFSLLSTVQAADESVSNTIANRMAREAVDAGAAGDLQLREDLLDRALFVAPDCAPARWARGEMLVDDQWQSIAQLQQSAAQNPHLDKYQQMRNAAENTAYEHKRIGRWCEQHNLTDQARYHWLAVLAVDRNNREALTALDSEWFGRELISVDDFEQRLSESRRTDRLSTRWRARIVRWDRLLTEGGEKAVNALAELEATVDETAIREFQRVARTTRSDEVQQ